MSAQLANLVQQATAAAGSGRMAEAEVAWNRVVQLDPAHPQALYSLGVHAFQRRDFTKAAELVRRAQAASPSDPMLPLTLAVIHRELGQPAAEWAAIQAALAIDAYFLPGLLAMGAFQELEGQAKTAALTFANALKVAPPQAHWPPSLAPQLQHAQEVSQRHVHAFAAHLASATQTARETLSPQARNRWTEAVSVMAGVTKPYLSNSNQLLVPRLPAIPFYDRADFPWVAALEAKTEVIRDELLAVLAEQQAEFVPYITYKPGEPVNQWMELNHSTRWSTYVLWRSGAPVAEHLARCPQTAKVLGQVEMAQIGGLCPNVMFSALAPHTEIPPHHGETNARLVVHLPLVVPEKCTYRVGFEERGWNVGEVLIFDDTLEHTARNDSDELRVVLIFDVWNPLLSLEEREVVKAMTDATRGYYGG